MLLNVTEQYREQQTVSERIKIGKKNILFKRKYMTDSMKSLNWNCLYR